MPNRADSGATPPDRLPLRWAVIGLAATTAGIACFNAIGITAAVIVSIAVARALHAMLE